MPGNDWWNRYVFSLWQKAVKEEDDWISGERLVQGKMRCNTSLPPSVRCLQSLNPFEPLLIRPCTAMRSGNVWWMLREQLRDIFWEMFAEACHRWSLLFSGRVPLSPFTTLLRDRGNIGAGRMADSISDSTTIKNEYYLILSTTYIVLSQ